jgi:hypothetical protein
MRPFSRPLAYAIVLLVVAVLLPFGTLKAQTVTGTILGNVLDPSGAAVANVQITVTNQDTGVSRAVTTTADGVYTVPSLIAGKYSVQATAQGFTTQQVRDMVLNVGSTSRVDFTLQVGQVTQQVTVTEAVPQVQTTSSEVSQVMDSNLIAAIPLNARDLQQLAQVQPAVTMLYTASYGKTLSVGGDRISNNRFLQEGIDMTTSFRQSPVSLASNILMGADAVKEFEVITENPPVEYGEESGGVINTIFKSGTNNFHGTAFDEYRNNVFDARNFFDGASAPPLHRQQFGASVGGPIRKDKTFFFADYEGFHADTSQSFTAVVPDALARGNGTLAPCQTSGSFACPTGFATGTPFVVGQLPCGQNGAPVCAAGQVAGTPSALDNVPVNPEVYNAFFGGYGGNAGIPLLPACTGPELFTSTGSATGTCNLSTNPDNKVRENYGVIKIDHTLTSKNTLSGTYNMDDSTSYTPNQTAINADDIYFRQQTGSIQDTQIISNNLVNTFRFGVHRLYYAGNIDLVPPIAAVDPNIYVNPNPYIVSPRSPYPQFPQITISGLQTIGSTAQPGSDFEPRYIGYTSGNFDESVNWLRGAHAMHFGVQVHRWYDNNENYQANPRGEYSFPSEASFLSGVTTQNFTWAIPEYTDPLNGQTYIGTIARGEVLMAYGLYAEDTFKMKPNLTVTYGLRWEYAGAPSEEHNRITNLFGPGNPPSCGPYTCATATLGAPWYHPPKDNFAPRLGFNWDPFKKGTTSVRAGAGIYYSEVADSYWYPSIAFQYPNTASISVPGVGFPFINVGSPLTGTGSNSVVNAYLASKATSACAPGTPGGACLPTTLQTLGGVEPTYFKTPAKYSFNFAIQQQLPEKLTFEIAYIGSQARHLGRDISYQDYFPTTIETPGQLPAVNGVAIPGSVVNPQCQSAGSIECYYWAGAGLNNANLLGNVVGTNNATASTVPYATLCGPNASVAGGSNRTNCYNNPNWSNSITGQAEDANSMYNAMQVILERRVSPGFMARFNYTWAKCITDSSFEQPTGLVNGGSAAWPLSYIANAARGRCAFVPGQSVNLTLTYVTHWGSNLNSKVAKAVVPNWELTSQTVVQSGLPFNIFTGEDVARYASSPNSAADDRPNWAAPSAACPNPTPTGAILPNWKSSPNLTYLNPACFAPAAPGYLGNIGNMVFTGPGLFSTDVSLRKTIPMRESKSFVISADMFNVFNRTNFPPPQASSVFNTSGQVVSTFSQVGTGVYFPTITTSRQFQVNARFVF